MKQVDPPPCGQALPRAISLRGEVLDMDAYHRQVQPCKIAWCTAQAAAQALRAGPAEGRRAAGGDSKRF